MAENRQLLKSRIYARQAVLSIYYERCIKDDPFDDSTTLLEFDDVLNRNIIGEEGFEYLNRMLISYEKNLSVIDELIANNSNDWKISMMPKVDLSILRLAVSEMLYMEDIPVGVSVSEAVNLAKTYSHDNAPDFVNGVLRSIAKTIEK